MRNNGIHNAAILVALLLSCELTSAQTPENTTAPTESDDTSASPVRIVERSPRIIYARNAQGDEVPFINIPLERIQTLLDREDGIIQERRPPEYQIDQLKIRGRTEADRALLNLDIEITTLIPDDSKKARWVAIPLRMHDSSLVEPPTYEGDGQMFLSFDENDGYQAWIRHQTTGKHHIRLNCWTNLSRTAFATQLRFLPPAASVSRLELTVLETPVTANIENGQNLVVATAGANSMLTATDLRNQVAVVWRDGDVGTGEKIAYLDARGDIQVSVDGPGAIRSNVSLEVKSYGGDVESFALRLPPHTTIVSVTEEAYQISQLNSPASEADDNRQTVQVTLDKPGPLVQLQLTTQTTLPAEDGGSTTGQLINVANFEVLDALRQSGRVSLLASEDWLVYWYLGSSVRRVTGPDEAADVGQRKRLASFEYFRQPCRLDVEIKPQSTRVSVDPTYRIKVEEDRVTLDAMLRYRIRGARVSFLEFALNGWQLDDVGPSTTVENDHFQDDANPNVKLRLTQPRTGEVELVLNLHRRFTESEGTLRFPLPWPSSDNLIPGTVIVTAVDSIALNYRLQEMVGLVQDTLPADLISTVRLSSTTQPPTAFRMRHDRAPGDVVIDYQVRDREMSVRSDTVAEVAGANAKVTQQFSYRVLYEPASRLSIDLPRQLYDLLTSPRDQTAVTISIDDQPINPDTLMSTNDDIDQDDPTVPVSLPLTQPRLGSFGVRLQFSWPLQATPGVNLSTIPLAIPRDGRLLSNTARLSVSGRTRVELKDDNWEPDPNVTPAGSTGALALKTDERADALSFDVTQMTDGDQVTRGATVVQRAWVQTWLARNSRRDRAVYQITSGADQLSLELDNANLDHVDVLVDGSAAAAGEFDEGELAIRIPGSTRRNHTVEVVLHYNSRANAGVLRFKMPEFRDAKPAQRSFWQLILPAGEDVLLSDARLTSANRWIRDGWFWKPRGTSTQPTLESWTGATTQANVPESANQYLFSSFDQVNDIEIRTSQRRTLIYVTSAAVLIIGLALIYVPLMRQPVVVLLAAIALAACGALYPAAAVLLAQAGLLGCVLIAVGLLAQSIMRWIANRRDAAYHRSRRSTELSSSVHTTWRESTGQSTTTTAPVPALPVVVPDSKA